MMDYRPRGRRFLNILWDTVELFGAGREESPFTGNVHHWLITLSSFISILEQPWNMLHVSKDPDLCLRNDGGQISPVNKREHSVYCLTFLLNIQPF